MWERSLRKGDAVSCTRRHNTRRGRGRGRGRQRGPSLPTLIMVQVSPSGEGIHVETRDPTPSHPKHISYSSYLLPPTHPRPSLPFPPLPPSHLFSSSFLPLSSFTYFFSFLLVLHLLVHKGGEEVLSRPKQTVRHMTQHTTRTFTWFYLYQYWPQWITCSAALT